MTKILIVVGSPGAGKSTLLGDKSIAGKYKVMNLGDLLSKVALSKGYVKDRDQVRYLPRSLILRLYKEAGGRMPPMDGDVIIDTHASVEAHNRFDPGITFKTEKILKHAVGLVYIDATNDEIRERRMKDRKRTREIESEATLNRQRIINMATLSYYSSLLNIPLYIIDNTEGKLRQTLKTFLEDAADAFGGK
jgi:adenylate kinase